MHTDLSDIWRNTGAAHVIALLILLVSVAGCGKSDPRSSEEPRSPDPAPSNRRQAVREIDLRLARAVAEMDLPGIRESLKEGASPDTLDEKGWRVLSQAANLPSTDAILVLLAAGANVNATDDDGSTPLIHAACADRRFQASVETWRLRNTTVLLQNGADVNAKNKRGLSALHYAARLGIVSVNRLLLNAGADPNAKSVDGKTPLDMARERGHEDVVKLLRQHGPRD